MLFSAQKLTHVTVGQLLVLSCQATGEPPPHILWFKDGAGLTESTGRVAAFESQGFSYPDLRFRYNLANVPIEHTRFETVLRTVFKVSVF